MSLLSGLNSTWVPAFSPCGAICVSLYNFLQLKNYNHLSSSLRHRFRDFFVLFPPEDVLLHEVSCTHLPKAHASVLYILPRGDNRSWSL